MWLNKIKEKFVIIKNYSLYSRYIIVGAGTALFEYCTLIFLVEYTNAPKGLSNIIALLLSGLANYLLSRYWVFGKSSHRLFYEFILFWSAVISSMVINHLLFLFFINVLFIHYKIAKLMVIGIIVIYNFLFKKMIVFRKAYYK